MCIRDRWLADYYLCPKVSALQSMLPAGLNLTGKLPQTVVEKRVYLVPNATEPRNAKTQQLVWSYFCLLYTSRCV